MKSLYLATMDATKKWSSMNSKVYSYNMKQTIPNIILEVSKFTYGYY